jgi:hypothetical protein
MTITITTTTTATDDDRGEGRGGYYSHPPSRILQHQVGVDFLSSSIRELHQQQQQQQQHQQQHQPSTSYHVAAGWCAQAVENNQIMGELGMRAY